MFITLVIGHLIWTEPSKTQHTNTTKKQICKFYKLTVLNKIYLLLLSLFMKWQKFSMATKMSIYTNFEDFY
jgi:hypothetical protein